MVKKQQAQTQNSELPEKLISSNWQREQRTDKVIRSSTPLTI